MPNSLVINEIYLSLQGESTFAGLPCVFVRLTGCNLRCSYCDTAYAFNEGQRRSFAEIRAEADRLGAPYRDGNHAFRLPLIEFTGGEPLLQHNTAELMRQFCEDGYTVLVETSGAIDLSQLDPRIRRIMDLKAPSSGESGRNRWSNLGHLRPTDEIKFVLGTREDYDWMRRVIRERKLAGLCPLLVSWVAPLAPHQQHPSLKAVPGGQTPMSRQALAEAIIADHLPVRFQLQMHKYIWPADRRSV